MAKVTISNRDSQIIAISLFGKGNDEAVFRTPSRIHPRTKAALDDLVKMGVVIFSKSSGAHVYRGNKTVLGTPRIDYAPIKEDEDFPIVK